MSIRILTDSTSDILPQEAQQRGIDVIPMQLFFGEEGFRDQLDIDHQEFFRRLAQAEKLPTTSQPTPDDFLPFFQRAKEQGDTLVCVLLASKLSGTLQSAAIAKQLCGYSEIYLVDSTQTTVGLRVLVDLACLLVQDGKSAPEIVEELEKAAQRVRLLAMVDTLEYLHKGGRLPGAVTVVGTLLKVKPLITLHNGELGLIGKGMGTKDALKNLLKQLGEQPRWDSRVPLYFGYTQNQSLCQQLQELVEEQHHPNNVQTCSVGAVIGAHVGPGATVLCYLEQE